MAEKDRDNIILGEATVDQLFREMQSRFASLLITGTRCIQEGDTEPRFYMQFSGPKTVNLGCAVRAEDILKQLCIDDCSQQDGGLDVEEDGEGDE